MKQNIAAVLAILVVASASVYAVKTTSKTEKEGKVMATANIEIIKNSSISSAKGPGDYFTGDVRVDGFLPSGHESGVSLAHVTFEPGARTAWHTHPKGQILVVTSGSGLVQQEGGQALEINPGDVVWFPAGLKHWHGAAKNHSMTHISIVVEQEGKNADWMEKVTDKQYGK